MLYTKLNHARDKVRISTNIFGLTTSGWLVRYYFPTLRQLRLYYEIARLGTLPGTARDIFLDSYSRGLNKDGPRRDKNAQATLCVLRLFLRIQNTKYTARKHALRLISGYPMHHFIERRIANSNLLCRSPQITKASRTNILRIMNRIPLLPNFYFKTWHRFLYCRGSLRDQEGSFVGLSDGSMCKRIAVNGESWS